MIIDYKFITILVTKHHGNTFHQKRVFILLFVSQLMTTRLLTLLWGRENVCVDCDKLRGHSGGLVLRQMPFDRQKLLEALQVSD